MTLEANNPEATPFDFDALPKLTYNQVKLEGEIRRQYSFLEDSKDFFSHFLKPFQQILPGVFSIEFLSATRVDLATLELKTHPLPLRCLLKVLPNDRMALLSFDPLLAKWMVTATLSGGELKPSQILSETMRPLTCLEEGVVEYLVISCIEEIEKEFQKKDFSIRYETLMTPEQKLTSYFSAADELVLFSFAVEHPQKTFYFQMALPLSLTKNFSSEKSSLDFLKARQNDFSNFKIDFEIQAGTVELDAEDFDHLAVQDIILLDQAAIESAYPNIKGKVRLVPVGLDTPQGFELELKTENEKIMARVLGPL